MDEYPKKGQAKKTMGNQTIDALSVEETVQLIHDLHIHQAEMEAATESLAKAKSEIAQLRCDYADLFDVTPIGLFIFNGNWLLTTVNHAGAAMLGLDKKVLEGRPFPAFVATESVAEFLDYLHKAESTGRRQVIEIRLRRPGGGSFPAECDTMPVFDEQGKFRHFRIVITDMTTRKLTGETMADRVAKP